jgi:2,4-dienoyl-CoA reductase-like NADH-dependent reductase (Old Yellow Enzyme family)
VSILFSPISLRGIEFENRVVVSPMCEYSAEDGVANDWHVVNLGHYALSGPGLVFFEATAVSPEARITDRDLGLYSDACEAGMERVVAFVRRWARSKIGVQLAHAGRKASTLPPWEGGGSATGERAYQTVAPSAIAYGDWHTPAALDEAGLEKVKRDFVAAAQRCARLGIDVIELHFAHGYLGHQFLSPLTNQRTDAYGGALENRMRFPLELFDAVRAAWPEDRVLGARISATDWADGGWDVEQSVAFVQALQQRGCDFIDVSSGGLVPHQQIPVGPGYQVPFSLTIKRATRATTMAVGMITEPAQAETILASGDADFIAIARGFIRNPRWTWDAADALRGDAFVPPQYERGRKTKA